MLNNKREWINNDFEGKSNQSEEKGKLSKKTERKFTEEEILAKKKNAYDCDVPLWFWANPVQYFLDYVENGENCYCVLNWKKIYSIDVINISQERWCDLEDAFYLLFYWKTKIECLKERAENAKQHELERKRKELETIEKIPWWIEKGKKYIDQSKWWVWENYVNSSARGTYRWADVDATLELLKLIDSWEPWEKVQESFDNQVYGYCYNIVRDRVVYFSEKWQEADKKLKGYY